MKMSMAQCQPQDSNDPCRKITFNKDLDETYPTEIFALAANNDPEREVAEDEATPVLDTYEVFDSYGAPKTRFIIHEGVDADEELRGVLIPDLVVIAMDALERLAKGSNFESALMDAHHNLRTSLLTMHMIRAQARSMDRETQDHLRPIGIY